MPNKLILGAAALAMALSASAQDGETIKIKPESGYSFTVVKDIEATPVQSQGRTGTCWSFSAP